MKTANEENKNQESVAQSRQWVGRRSIRRLMSALTHPPTTRRQGYANGRAPLSSITANSKSRSNGAVNMSCHMNICPKRFSNALKRMRSLFVLSFAAKDLVFESRQAVPAHWSSI